MGWTSRCGSVWDPRSSTVGWEPVGTGGCGAGAALSSGRKHCRKPRAARPLCSPALGQRRRWGSGASLLGRTRLPGETEAHGVMAGGREAAEPLCRALSAAQCLCECTHVCSQRGGTILPQCGAGSQAEAGRRWLWVLLLPVQWCHRLQLLGLFSYHPGLGEDLPAAR